MKDRLKKVLEAITENHQWHREYDEYDGYGGSVLANMNMESIAILRDLIDAPEPEPVAEATVWLEFGRDVYEIEQFAGFKDLPVGKYKLYTAPPQRNVKPWRERLLSGYEPSDQVEAMQAEIDELRELGVK